MGRDGLDAAGVDGGPQPEVEGLGLVEVDRRRLVFRVQVTDAAGLVGEGTHERFIIDEARFGAKAKERKDTAR